jgi:hypothetical protein
MASFPSALPIAILLSIRHISLRSCQSSCLAVQQSRFSYRHTSMSSVGSHRSSLLQHATFRAGRLINCEHGTKTAHANVPKREGPINIWQMVVGFAKSTFGNNTTPTTICCGTITKRAAVISVLTFVVVASQKHIHTLHQESSYLCSNILGSLNPLTPEQWLCLSSTLQATKESGLI